METAKAVPPRQGGKRIADRFASFLGAFEKAKREIVTADAKVTDTFSCMTMLQTIFLSRIVTSRLVGWWMRRPVCGRRFLTNG